MNKIVTLQIRNSGEDYEVYLCMSRSIAERIVREWFYEYATDDPILEELEEYLFTHEVGYFEITEKEVLCE